MKEIPIKVPGWSTDVYHLALALDAKSAVAIIGDPQVQDIATIDLETGTIKQANERPIPLLHAVVGPGGRSTEL